MSVVIAMMSLISVTHLISTLSHFRYKQVDGDKEREGERERGMRLI